jgi:hypothetical protein
MAGSGRGGRKAVGAPDDAGGDVDGKSGSRSLPVRNLLYPPTIARSAVKTSSTSSGIFINPGLNRA